MVSSSRRDAAGRYGGGAMAVISPEGPTLDGCRLDLVGFLPLLIAAKKKGAGEMGPTDAHWQCMYDKCSEWGIEWRRECR
jgi:hypothetical protein